jgi:hypothetical protein
MPDTYFSLEDVKEYLGETGDTNDIKLNQYGLLADNDINTALLNLIPSIPETDTAQLSLIKPVADALTIGYFYKIENGSVDILEAAQVQLANYIDARFRRIGFKTSNRP